MPNELIAVAAAQAALATAIQSNDINAMRDIHATATALQSGARVRGLGIEAENKAAVVVATAERSMGQAVIHLREEGKLQATAGRPGNSPKSGPFAVLADYGLETQRVSEWLRLAALSDLEFETRLDEAARNGGRIARTNLLRPVSPPTPRDVREQAESPTDHGFALFRSGVFELLGWQVDDEGTGTPTKNGLLVLPTDELRTLATLVSALVAAYRQAVAARG